MKYLDLITDAYRLRNVIDENETPSAEQGRSGLRLLNQMCATWKARGIDINYFSTNKTSDTLTIPEWAEQGVTAQLAIRVSAGGAITPELQLMADEGMTAILSKTIDVGFETDTDNMPRGEAQPKSGSFFNG
jgi:hypothetical protein